MPARRPTGAPDLTLPARTGTHGRTGLINLLMGRVAEYVVRHARCPVLSVPSRPRGEAPLPEPAIDFPPRIIQPL